MSAHLPGGMIARGHFPHCGMAVVWSFMGACFMKLLQDRGQRARRTAIPSLVVFVRNQSAVWPANRLRGVLLLLALFAARGATVGAQTAGHPAESAQMQQLHQALSLDQHGDRQGAMNLALRLLEQYPDFEPALKLKGVLLEEAGHTSEAAAAYEEALKLAPNDPDVLLEVGKYKLTAGQKEEAIKLLEHCIRILPGDGDAQYYLAQAYT